MLTVTSFAFGSLRSPKTRPGLNARTSTQCLTSRVRFFVVSLTVGLVCGCSFTDSSLYLGSWQSPNSETRIRFESNGTGTKSVLCDDGSIQKTTFNWTPNLRGIAISEYIGDGLESVFLEYQAQVKRENDQQHLQIEIYEQEFVRPDDA